MGGSMNIDLYERPAQKDASDQAIDRYTGKYTQILTEITKPQQLIMNHLILNRCGLPGAYVYREIT